MRDTRLSLEQVYYPLIRALVAEISSDTVYLRMDESAHTNVVGIFQIALISDATALPLGFIVYDAADAWADDAWAVTVLKSALFQWERSRVTRWERVFNNYIITESILQTPFNVD